VLLERGGELDVLQTALRRAARGAGSIVLVSGEAGIGKTSLVRAFVGAATPHATVLQGAL
jgi:predicted ATPase